MQSPSPQVIIVFGLPGSGKSYFARHFAQAIQSEYCNSDLLRKELFPEPSYTQTEKEAVYTAMQSRMKSALQKGKTIILDATFYQAHLRQQFIQTAEEAGHKPLWIEIKASEPITRTRVSRPRPDSDADWEVYKKVRDQFEPLQNPFLSLSSDSEDLEGNIRAAKKYIELKK